MLRWVVREESQADGALPRRTGSRRARASRLGRMMSFHALCVLVLRVHQKRVRTKTASLWIDIPRRGTIDIQTLPRLEGSHTVGGTEKVQASILRALRAVSYRDQAVQAEGEQFLSLFFFSGCL